jgi:SAM-dependent methyltransferase
MLIRPYALRPLNLHYEGSYSASAMEWRRVGAADKARNVERMVSGHSVASVLEVGCGTGAVLAEIARRGVGSRHAGIDWADPSQHADVEASSLDLRSYDGTTIPFEDGAFDLVFATHVVEHVQDPRTFLRELARVSRSLIYVEIPCEMTVRLRRAAVQSALDTGHINAYSPEHFLILLQTAGLDVVDLRLFDHSLDVHAFGTSRAAGRLRQAVRATALRFNPLLASRLFCYHCGALAIKQGHNEA